MNNVTNLLQLFNNHLILGMKKHLLSMLLFLLFFTVVVHGQNKTITGIVTSKDDGLPLPGVSVVVKGTAIGTQTSGTGRYSVIVPQGNSILIFTYVSFRRTERLTTNGDAINVMMETDSKALSEVVVTGVGVATSKRKLGIDVQAIRAENLPQVPSASIDQALVGKIPGAQISSVDGTPGAKTNIILRGINTLQSSTTPLIMLDGVQLGAGTDLSSLDQSTIERIEVVQGAAAATIYGAQGANGVIQVFTRKGKLGKPKISFASSYGSSSYLNIGNVHQSKLHGFRTDASNNVTDSKGNIITINPNGSYTGIAWAYPTAGVSAMANPLNITNKPYDHNLKYYDHLSQLFTNAKTYNSNFSVAGASEKSDYLIGYSYNKQESAVRGAGDYTRMNLTSNIGTELFKGFTIRSSTQLIHTTDAQNPNFLSGNNSIYQALNTSPFFDFNHKLADGTYPYRLNAGVVSVNGANPFYYEEYSNRLATRVDIIENLDANYKINKFVEVDARYGVNYDANDDHQVYKNQSQNINASHFNQYIGKGTDNTGSLQNYSTKTLFQNANLSAFIRTDFKKDFHINIPLTTSTQLSYDYRKNKESDFNTQGNGLPAYAIYNMGQTNNQQVTYDYVTPFITFGYLVNQKFDYGDFGGLSAGVRSDYSSAFGGGSKPFTFPRADAYIRPSSFDFWKNGVLGAVIPEIKFRGAYGEAGIQPHPFDRYVTLSTQNIGNSLGFYLPNSQSNPALKPEVSKELELGSDFSIAGTNGNAFKSFNFGLTYWKRNGSNVISGINNAPSTGSDKILTNAIDLSSHGFEAALNIEAYTSKKFTWNFTANFGTQTSTIDHINGPDIILASQAGSTALILSAGSKIGQIYGYKALTSISQTNKEGVAYIAPADYGNYQIVNARVVNRTTKGIQFTNEAYSFGDPNPKFNMSFINNLQFAGFITLNFQFDWVHGSHLYNQTKEWMYRDGISGDYANKVNIGGSSAAYTAYYRSAYADFFGAQNGARNSTKDYFYEDASFVRLRNLSVAVDLARFTNKKVFSRMQVVLSGRNLVTWTKYTGFDPEISSGQQGSAYDRGVDHSSMPNVKTYQLGLNIGF